MGAEKKFVQQKKVLAYLWVWEILNLEPACEYKKYWI